jgi:biopolymer transport protein ExbD
VKIGSPIQRKHTRIEIIPLIDIMFFLLASFMMVSLEMEQTQNVRVNLPPATEGVADYKPNMVNIAVDKNGGVWLEKKAITLEQLSLVLSNRFRLDTNLPVYVSGDTETREGAMTDVLRAARNAGAQKVAFMVSDSAEGGAHP